MNHQGTPVCLGYECFEWPVYLEAGVPGDEGKWCYHHKSSHHVLCVAAYEKKKAWEAREARAVKAAEAAQAAEAAREKKKKERPNKRKRRRQVGAARASPQARTRSCEVNPMVSAPVQSVASGGDSSDDTMWEL